LNLKKGRGRGPEKPWGTARKTWGVRKEKAKLRNVQTDEVKKLQKVPEGKTGKRWGPNECQKPFKAGGGLDRGMGGKRIGGGSSRPVDM